MNIAIAVDEKFVKYACVMLTSVFENHPEQEIQVFVLFGQISEKELENFKILEAKYHQKIHLINMKREWFPEKLPHTKEWPVEVYYRLALPDILPKELDRVLYLDVDIIVRDSIWDFYSSDFQGKSLCACQDMSALEGMSSAQYELFKDYMTDPDFKYFNTGVLLMNLEKMRTITNLDFFIETGLKLNLVAPDQDLLNYVFYGDVRYFDEYRYDLFAKLAFNKGLGYDWVVQNTAIIHFAGRKPWHYETLHYDTEKFWWQYAGLTPFYMQFLEDVVLNEVESGFMNNLIDKMSSEKQELNVALQKCIDLLKRLEK